jgi:hypothetical protein
LFGLHLTGRSCNAQIEAALNWLLEHIEIQTDRVQVSAEDVAGVADLRSLPFVSGRPDMLLTAATLFLAAIFGRDNDPDVLAVYQRTWNTFLAIHALRNKRLL